MTGQSTRRWLQLSFLFMAGYASAGSLKLSDFESVSDKSFPDSCVQAYDTPLSDCTPSDFTGGKACSASCKDSVSQAQGFIQTSCSDVETDAESLLSRGQKGNLVAVLCRDMDESQTKPEQESKPETQAPVTTVTSAAATKVKDNVMIETSHSSTDEDSKGSLNGPPLSSVNEDLATKSTILAIDTDQPTGSMPAPPSEMTTSVTKAKSPSHTADASSEASSPTPTTAAGAIHAPSLGFMCASFAMSSLLYMVLN
ncbi:hypothetical protein NW762_007284 [Fusarium torreyae]|uniref:Extracellular membrane protein CFEM domain-containing protein n=1 Tax=Fusarium torreyae TaxID=1237075 RepID=A0A9W8S1G1_9HYPO|nr:hypothetical protein NW762_007284 [Fusarium torreyae]